MIFRTLFLLSILLFSACSDKNTKSNTDLNTSGSIADQNNTTLDQNESSQTILPLKTPKTVTIYIHGYNKSGYKREGVYGDINHDDVIDKVVEFTGFPTMFNYDKESFTNIIAITPYYGDEAPAYYSEDDINDIAIMTQRYGGGVPRYAAIIAKFAKHVMAETEAERINIVSGSFGSLITRWMIEKDIENLASDKKIARWLTIEGVLRGNYALSSERFLDLATDFFEESVDTEHMSYDWITENLTRERDKALSPLYKDILIGQMSSTDSETDQIGLNYLLALNGGFIPNDGYQLLRDTYFAEMADEAQFYAQTPTHTLLHVNHTGFGKDDGAHAVIATFLESNTRVKITLVNATVDDIKETTNIFSKDAEIVFESRVYSALAAERWGIEDAISERVYDSGALFVHGYKKDGETRYLNQVLFDDFVQSDQEILTLNMSAYEIDRSTIYNINELFLGANKEDLGDMQIEIPIKNDLLEIISDDAWRGYLKVEVINYPF